MVKVDPLRAGMGMLPGVRRRRKGEALAGDTPSAASEGGIPDFILPLVEEINESSKELTADPTGHSLDRYRQAVRRFLDAAVADCLRISSEASLGLSRKVFSTIARADVALGELADAVLGRQHDMGKVRGIVDQIKGLLIDLYR